MRILNLRRLSSPVLEPVDFWYIVGYGLGDGWISEVGSTFAVKSTDKQVVDEMAGKLHVETQAQPYGSRSMVCYSASVFRTEFVEQLQALGFPKNKSHTDGWLVVPASGYEPQFLRGLMDSDGCGSSTAKRGKLKSNFITSSKRMAEWVQEHLAGVFGGTGCIWRHGNTWALDYGKWDTHELFHYLYDAPGIRNVRKEMKARALLLEFPVRRGAVKKGSLRFHWTEDVALEKVAGLRSITHAAEVLGVSRDDLSNYMKSHREFGAKMREVLG